MSKYKHAMEIIENWERVEIGFGYPERSWNEAKQSPDSFTLSQLNDRALFRLKPTPRKVPFGPEDIRSDMWFRHKQWDPCVRHRAIYCRDKEVKMRDVMVSYETLQKEFVFRMDGCSKELPCEKEVEG